MTITDTPATRYLISHFSSRLSSQQLEILIFISYTKKSYNTSKVFYLKPPFSFLCSNNIIIYKSLII